MKVLIFLLTVVVYRTVCEDDPWLDPMPPLTKIPPLINEKHEEDHMKLKIKINHELKYRRYMETERETCNRSVRVAGTLTHRFFRDLDALLTSTVKHINLISLCVNAKVATQCIKMLSTFPADVVTTEFENFNTCMRPAIQAQIQLNETFPSLFDSYRLGYSTALEKISTCESQYPNLQNKDQKFRCIQRNYRRYFLQTINITVEQFQSPCMQTFVNNVITCVTKSSQNMKVKTDEYRSLLSMCANIDDMASNECSETNDFEMKLEPSVLEQIEQAQHRFTALNLQFEDKIEQLFKVNLKASRTPSELTYDFINDDVNKMFSPYLTTVNRTLADNRHPAERDCGLQAELSIRNIIAQGVEVYKQCYQETVTRINSKVKEIREEYNTIGEKLKIGGNVSILECLDAGFVFGTNAIIECFDLKLRELSNTVDFEALEKRMAEIEDVDLSFDSPKTLPCVTEILEDMTLDADKALFAYKRCMYISTGTDYSVTTPHPSTTESYSESTDSWFMGLQ